MSRPELLFLRAYHAFQGGHLKVADYMRHAQASGLFTPRLHLTPGSLADHPFPRGIAMADWQPERADALFVAGVDWAQVPAGVEEHVPVINLIQHPRHALAGDPRFAFLARRALRICVSQEIADLLCATGAANGPIHTIPAGLDIDAISDAPKCRHVLICGVKQPALALATADLLRDHGVPVIVLTTPITRDDFLRALSRAQIAITLPDAAEGFYLPALEAMAAGCAVICPDALGNRSVCRHGDTCLMPRATPQALALAAQRLLANPALAARLVRQGQERARANTLWAERAAFLPLLGRVAAQVRPVSATA